MTQAQNQKHDEVAPVSSKGVRDRVLTLFQLVSVAVGCVLLAGGMAWGLYGSLHGDAVVLHTDMQGLDDRQNTMTKDVAALKPIVLNLQDNLKEVKDNQKEMNKQLNTMSEAVAVLVANSKKR